MSVHLPPLPPPSQTLVGEKTKQSGKNTEKLGILALVETGLNTFAVDVPVL